MMRIEVAISVPERLLVALERIGLALAGSSVATVFPQAAAVVAPAAAPEVGHVSESDHSNQREPTRDATEVAAVETSAPAADEHPHAEAREGDRREGSDPAPTTGAPGPSPVDEAGLLPQVLPSLPTVAAPAAAIVPGRLPADPAFAARGDAPAAWRTPEREVRLRALWVDPAWSQGAIWRALAGMPGPLMSGLSAANIKHWAAKLALGARPELSRSQTEAVRLANMRRGKAAAKSRAEGRDDEAGPVALLPAGEIRETPQLARAREMLGMGLHPNDIKTAVKLSAVEMQAIRDAHAEAAA